MKRYFFYDNVLQSEKAPSIAVATRALFDFLNLTIPRLQEAKADLGSEMMALDKKQFIEHNAHTIALASTEDAHIICVENSGFISLKMTLEALINDTSLYEKIVESLAQKSIKLNLDIEILQLETFLVHEVGLETLARFIKHPFDAFYIASFLGTSSCQTRKFTDIALKDALIELVHAKKIPFETAYESDGFEVFESSELLAKRFAAKTLLDMFDNGADFILVDDVRSFIMFDFYQRACEKVAGREIGLSVLTIPQLLLLAFGMMDKEKLGLDQHKIPVTLI